MIQDPAASVIVVLDTDEQRAEFQELLQSCKKRVESGTPEGLLEKFLVEEIATQFWKLQIALGLEIREL